MPETFPFNHFLKPLEKKVDPNRNQKEKASTAPQNGKKSELLESLRDNIAPRKFEKFFAKTFTVKDIQDKQILFQVNSEQDKTSILKDYSEILKECIFETFNKKINFKIEVHKSNVSTSTPFEERPRFKLELDETEDDVKSKIESTYINHMNPEPQGRLIDEKKRFENFIIGASNHLAFATAKAVAKTPGKNGKYPSLYIHSNSGLGKTHLMQAIGHHVLSTVCWNKYCDIL